MAVCVWTVSWDEFDDELMLNVLRCQHTCTQTHAHRHTHMHTHICTHTHTYIHSMYVCPQFVYRWIWLIDDCLYSAILHSRADSLHSHVILHEWLSFYGAFLNIHQSGVLTALAWLVPHETAAVSAQFLCAPYNHAPFTSCKATYVRCMRV